MVESCQQRLSMCERRGCWVIGIARAVNAYRSRRRSRTELRERTREIAAMRMRYGYRKIQCCVMVLTSIGGNFHFCIATVLLRPSDFACSSAASARLKTVIALPSPGETAMPSEMVMWPSIVPR